MVDQARYLQVDIMSDVDVLGEYLHEGWMRKKELSSLISTSHIDDVYNAARKAGATGGKLLGAGGAGFMLLYVPNNFHKSVCEALSCYPIHFLKPDTAGSVIIYDDMTDKKGVNICN